MNRTASLLLAVLVVASPLAARAVPNTVSFAARLADSGRPVTGPHAFTFKLFDAATLGTELWKWSATDTPASLPVNDGVVTYSLGSDNPIPAVVFNGLPAYLEVTVDGVALAPRMAIQSVPYALRAAVADSVPFSGVTGMAGNLVAVFSVNKDAVTNGLTGLYPMTTYTPPVNVRVTLTIRCSFDSGTVGQQLSFRAGLRTPPGTGTATQGSAYEQADTLTVINSWVSNTVVDTFDLNAGVAYELGPFFLGSSPSGGTRNDFCSLHGQAFQR